MSFYANEFELASLAGPRGLALRGQWQGSCPNAHRQAAGVGCAYFKTDFMHFGCEYGPQQARRHQEGPSRIEIWMRLVRLIREEIGAATWMASGGRDIGVSRQGHYSAESLLRDQTARNFANGIFWQAAPDWQSVRLGEQVAVKTLDAGHHCVTTERGVQVSVRPHASCRLLFSPRA